MTVVTSLVLLAFAASVVVEEEACDTAQDRVLTAESETAGAPVRGRGPTLASMAHRVFVDPTSTIKVRGRERGEKWHQYGKFLADGGVQTPEQGRAELRQAILAGEIHRSQLPELAEELEGMLALCEKYVFQGGKWQLLAADIPGGMKNLPPQDRAAVAKRVWDICTTPADKVQTERALAAIKEVQKDSPWASVKRAFKGVSAEEKARRAWETKQRKDAEKGRPSWEQTLLGDGW